MPIRFSILFKGRPLGCIAFGAGSIGNASIATLIKDLRSDLMNRQDVCGRSFDPEKYTVEEIAGIIADFLGAEFSKPGSAPMLPQMDIGILLGGYSAGKSSGEVWAVNFHQGKAQRPTRLRAENEAGINWGGSSEVLQRIMIGYSPAIFEVLAQVNSSSTGQVTVEQLFSELNPLLMAKLQAPVVFAPMPIQDAIDLAEFLVNAAIMYSRFIPGAQIVGGPIEIAAITKHEGFKWIRRKHHYNENLNPEPAHVIIDRPKQD
jgi:hypothetical protein